MKNEDMLNILYPPQWVSKILHLSISGAMHPGNHRGLKYELAYCVLPILSIEEIRNKLTRAKNTSSFFTIFEHKMIDKQEYSIDFSKRAEAFSKITKNGLIYLGNIEQIEFGKYITTVSSKTYQKNGDDADFQKASFYLGLLLAKEDYRHIMLKLGVVPS